MDPIAFPVGTHPGWEHDEGNGSDDSETEAEGEPQELRSVADSLVIFQSLRQSRNRWLSSAFPKFSAKARGGKPPEVVPPPHSIKAHGRFDVRIGPHVFPETTFYEVYYLPDTTAGSEPSSSHAPVFHAYRTQGPQQTKESASAAQVAVSALSSSPEVQKGLPDSSVTPDLVIQVSAAAATNPVLKDLLQLAASDKASAEQKKTLADLIRSMGAASKQSQPTASQPPLTVTSSHGAVAAPRPAAPLRQARDFDVVIEFQEKPSDRWIVPRGSTVCERVDSHPLSDILVTTAIPPTEHPQTGASEGADEPTPHVVSMRISNVSLGLWELLFRWVGGEEGMTKGRAALKNIADKQSPRTYLRYQLSDGPLLEQIKNTVPPRYNMKSIAPSNSNSSRSRKRTSRKHREAKAQVAGTTIISMNDRKHKSKTRVIEPAAPISCRSCGRADVPLLNFGRYCKNCINTNRVNDPVAAPSQAFSNSSPAATSQQTYAKPTAAVASPHAYVPPPHTYPNSATPAYQPWPYTSYTPYSVTSQNTALSSNTTAPPTREHQRSTTTEIVPVVVQASPKRSAHTGPQATTDHETIDLP